MLRIVMWCGAAMPAYPLTVTTPVEVGVPLAKLKPVPGLVVGTLLER